MLIRYTHGIFIQADPSIIIDPSKTNTNSLAVVTHAHSDHVSVLALNNSTQCIASPLTCLFLTHNYQLHSKNLIPLSYDEKLQFDNFTLSLHNSGHILGSAQVKISTDEDIVITGDIKLQDSLVCKKAESIQSDILVIESTFALPHYQFPPREETYEAMRTWIKSCLQAGKFVVLAGYPIGKAQELTKFCNEYLGITPLVHEKIYTNNQLCNSLGVDLGSYYKLNGNLKDSDILIMPPSLVSPLLLETLQFSLKKKVCAAKATGWPYRGFYDKIFPLSDHADFTQLMEYIQYTNPKKVLTYHAFPE